MFKFIIYFILKTLFNYLFLALIIYAIYALLIKSKEKESIKIKDAEKILIRIDNVYDDVSIGLNSKGISFYTLLDSLNELKNYDDIKEIILDIDNINLSITQIEELEYTFAKLRESKKIIAYSTSYDNNGYLTALLADEIYMLNSRNSNIVIKDYSKATNYYKLFLDKLGIKMNVLHIGDYKSAGENYSRERMSKENREVLTRIYGKFLENLVNKIFEKRGIDISKEIVNGELIFINYIKAKELNLINGSTSLDKLGVDLEENTITLNSFINSYKKKKNKSKNVIGVITLEGEIRNNSLKERTISNETVLDKIDKLNNLDNLKGVILRINSPGGSALESEIILRELKKIEVPIFISMGDYCASGGYYISTVSRKLYANKNTITGSIGVVAMIPKITETFNKLGINVEKINDSKAYDLDNLAIDLSEETKESLISSLKDVYFEFKKHVMTARIMTDKTLEPLAQGKVWLGDEAKNNGLVDEIGGFEKVVESLVKYLDLKDYKLEYIFRNKSIKENINDKLPVNPLSNVIEEINYRYNIKNYIMYYNDIFHYMN